MKTTPRVLFVLLICIPLFAKNTDLPQEEDWHIPDMTGEPGFIDTLEAYSEVKDRIPIRGTQYLIRVPKNWNGILISDLDYYTSAESAKYKYLLEKGYAISGTKRRPGRKLAYDPAHEIHDIISVLDIFEETFGKPKYTIQYGCSGGGTITLAISEIHPDRFDGGIAACGATSPWMANTQLDGLFVLKALIAPELPIVDLPIGGDEIKVIGEKWQQAIKEAQETPEGRARIALAMTIGQWPAWGGPGKAPVSEPDSSDANALQESMYLSLVRLLPSQRIFGTTMIELSAPGQIKFNTGIDYKEFYGNGDPAYKKAVEELYEGSGLNLEEDLAKINATPRIEADASAKQWWGVPGRTHVGEPKIPLLRIHTSGDALVYPSMAQGYEELVHENGYSDLYRSAYVNRWGHCSFSLAEFLAAIETMKQRLETGVWPSTEPEDMNILGMSLEPSADARYFNYKGAKKYNRTWVPGVDDFIGQ